MGDTEPSIEELRKSANRRRATERKYKLRESSRTSHTEDPLRSAATVPVTNLWFEMVATLGVEPRQAAEFVELQIRSFNTSLYAENDIGFYSRVVPDEEYTVRWALMELWDAGTSCRWDHHACAEWEFLRLATADVELIRSSAAGLMGTMTPANAVSDEAHPRKIDPSDLPDELDCANQAFRAVSNGYGEAPSFRNRLLAWIAEHRPEIVESARDRIATVANPDKTAGRKTHKPK